MCPDELMTDDLIRMFAARDAKRAKQSKKPSCRVINYQPKSQKINGTRAVGTSYLESSPAEDEFVSSSIYNSGSGSSGSRKIGDKRNTKLKEHRKHKNSTHHYSDSVHLSSKSTAGAKLNTEHSRNNPHKNVHYKPKHLTKSNGKKLNSIEKALLGAASGVVVGTAALTAALFSTPNKDAIKITAENYEHEPGIRMYETDENYNDINRYPLSSSDGRDYTFEIDEEGNTIVNVDEDVTADEIIKNNTHGVSQEQIDSINYILEENPDIKDAFNDTEIALRRASIEYGGDVIRLLEEMNDKFGLGRMPLKWQIALLEHESAGFFTDWQTGEVIVREDGDTGWYQITDIVEEDFDRIAKLLVKRGVAQEDVDEIKALGRSSMRGNAGYGAMYLSYLNILFDGDVEKVLSAFNAGEGFVNNGHIREDYVAECYGDHIKPLGKYDNALWEYIINNDYGEFENDGVAHVYVNSEDGSVRYPD